MTPTEGLEKRDTMNSIARVDDDSYLFPPGDGDDLRAWDKRWVLDSLAGWCDPITGPVEVPHSWFTVHGLRDA